MGVQLFILLLPLANVQLRGLFIDPEISLQKRTEAVEQKELKGKSKRKVNLFGVEDALNGGFSCVCININICIHIFCKFQN